MQLPLPSNEVHLFCGASGSGKTTLMLQAIREWEQEREFPIQFYASRVAYVTSDRAGTDVSSRIKKLGIVKIEHYSLIDDFTLPIESVRKREILLPTVTQLRLKHPYNLLVLDPVGLFLPPGLNIYHEAALGLFSLNRWAKKHSVTVIGIHHTTKMKSDADFLRPEDRINGSSALQGFSGSQLILIEGRETKSVYDRLFVRHHVARMEEYRLVRGNDGWFTEYEPEQRRNKAENEEDVLAVLDSLGDTFTTADFLNGAEQRSVARSTVFRILSSLKSEGKLKTISRGTYQKCDTNHKNIQNSTQFVSNCP